MYRKPRERHLPQTMLKIVKQHKRSSSAHAQNRNKTGLQVLTPFPLTSEAAACLLWECSSEIDSQSCGRQPKGTCTLLFHRPRAHCLCIQSGAVCGGGEAKNYLLSCCANGSSLDSDLNVLQPSCVVPSPSPGFTGGKQSPFGMESGVEWENLFSSFPQQHAEDVA